MAIHQPIVITVATYFSLPAPALKALSTRSEQATRHMVFANLFGGVLENLEEFRVASWKEIDWRRVSFRRLRVLDIEREISLDICVILGILAANPLLEVLRLHTFQFYHLYAIPNPIQAPIHLDHLKARTLMNLMETRGYSLSENGAPITHILQRVRFWTGILFVMRSGLETGSPSTPGAFMSLIPSPVETLANLPRKENGLQGADVNVEFAERKFLFEMREDPHSKPIFSISITGNGLPRNLAKDWTTGALRGVGSPIHLRLHVGTSGSEFL